MHVISRLNTDGKYSRCKYVYIRVNGVLWFMRLVHTQNHDYRLPGIWISNDGWDYTLLMVDKKQNTQYEESRTDITQPRVTPLSPNRLDNHHTALKGSHCPPVYLTFEQFCTNILFMLLLNTTKNLHISNQLYK